MVTFAPTRTSATVAPDPEAEAATDAQAGPSAQAGSSAEPAPRKTSVKGKPGGLGELSLPGGGDDAEGSSKVPSQPTTPALSTPPAQTPGAHKRRASSVTNLFHRGSVGTLVTDLQVDVDVPSDTQLTIVYAHIKDDPFVYRGDDFEGKATKEDRIYTRWHFYPHAFSTETLHVIAHRIFDRSAILNGVNAHDRRLIALIARTKELMYDHPFTCFQKSVDALQAAFMITEQPSVKEHLPRDERLAILLAAFVHDVDHPGFSNEYVVAVGHPLVDQHGADGALKKHQATVAGRLLEQTDTNVLTRAGADVSKAVRARVRELILAADVTQHERIMEQAREAINESSDGGTRAPSAQTGASGKKPSMAITTSDADVATATVENLVLAGHSLVVGQIIVKAAVLAHAARPPPVNERWACRMMKELHRQGDYERKLAKPTVSPFCDRLDDKNPTKCQIHVTRELARPVYQLLADMASETQPLLSLVDHNLERWEHVLDKGRNPAPRRASLGKRGSDMGASPARSPGILSAMRSPTKMLSPTKWAKNKGFGESSGAGLTVPGQTQQQ